MGTWHSRAKVTWTALVTLALGSAVLAAMGDSRSLPDQPLDWLVGGLLLTTAVALSLRPLELAPDHKVNAASTPLIALALLYDPLYAAIAGATAGLASQALLRRPWFVAVFNVAQRLLCMLAAGSTCVAVRRLEDGSATMACLGAGLVYFLVNTGAVSAMAAAQRRASWPATWWSVVRSEGPAEGGLIAVGALVAVHVRQAPIAIPLLAPPLWLVWRVLASTVEIRRLNQRLHEGLARQRQFLADASHELRTPLASLRAQLDVLVRQASAPDSGALVMPAVAQLESMRLEAARMSRLLADLMTLAHADEGAPLARGPVSLEDVLLTVYRETRPLAGAVDLQLTFDADSTTDLTVSGDAERLQQLFLNLVTNALRYTPDGGRVEVCCLENSGVAIVSVQDTGTGIAPDDLPRIFDRFFRADSARSRDRRDGLGGSGLGLSIARWVAEAHGGSIAVQSALGVGSTFTVRLPLAARAPQPLPRSAVPAATAAAR